MFLLELSLPSLVPTDALLSTSLEHLEVSHEAAIGMAWSLATMLESQSQFAILFCSNQRKTVGPGVTTHVLFQTSLTQALKIKSGLKNAMETDIFSIFLGCGLLIKEAITTMAFSCRSQPEEEKPWDLMLSHHLGTGFHSEHCVYKATFNSCPPVPKADAMRTNGKS